MVMLFIGKGNQIEALLSIVFLASTSSTLQL